MAQLIEIAWRRGNDRVSTTTITYESLRKIERETIRSFLEKNQVHLRGRVLDFGCGVEGKCVKPQPYRDLIQGEYVPFDIGFPKPEGVFDTILCTQVLQYIEDVPELFFQWRKMTKKLVITYPTNWQEVEANDFWRFTRAGLELLLRENGFYPIVHESRWELHMATLPWSGGYGLVACKN